MTTLRRLGLGKLAYNLWYAPRAFLRRCHQQGPLQLALAAHGHRLMKKAACGSFEPIAPLSGRALDIHFLTGHRYWHQTLFCGLSLLRVAEVPINFVIIDDGSLKPSERRRLCAALGRVNLRSISDDVLDRHLPRSRFPTLRARREIYPHLRKLIDVHVGQTGWKLVCDSDMLFLRKPTAMLDWLERPTRPCHLIDVDDAYGYSTLLLTQLIGADIAPRVNVGLCGLKSDDLDWDQLEHWCKQLIDEEGMKYLLEQALSAMLMSNAGRTSYDQRDYIVAPSRIQACSQIGVLQHYTAESKKWYYRFAWKNVREKSRMPANLQGRP